MIICIKKCDLFMLNYIKNIYFCTSLNTSIYFSYD